MGAEPNMLMGSIFFIVWLAIMLGMIGGWIVVVIAAWKGMRAHESIAESLRQIAQKSSP